MKVIGKLKEGEILIPPSKSIAHRAVICSALAKGGVSRLSPAVLSDDISATVSCMKALGADINKENETLFISAIKEKPYEARLNCLESGSTLRFIIPIAAALGIKAEFTGQGRLMERPLTPYMDIFKDSIMWENGKIKLCGNMPAGVFKLPGNISSQFVSGLLMALPLTGKGGEIFIEGALQSASYVDLTIFVMESFGVKVINKNNSYYKVEPCTYKPCDYSIEGDFSQAAFFMVAAALGAKVTCKGLNINSLQGDKAIIDILTKCGAMVTVNEDTVSVSKGSLKGITVDVSNIPDLVPPLAVLFTFCKGESRIINAQRLKIKESDRLLALSTELNKLGANIKCTDDSMIINGTHYLKGGNLDSWNDHRIAMAAAIAKVRCKEKVTISGFEAVNKSFPGFWDLFDE